MQYGIYNRSKQPRNKWGYINNVGGNVYSSNSIYGTNISPVGGSMVDVTDLSVFIGATEDIDGQAGIVPAPMAGEQQYFLQGSSTWVDIPAFRWIKEWPFDEGLEKTGIGVEGNFHVTDTISTMNLNVEGQAHFWELVIDKAKMQGGQIFVSPSLFQIDAIDKVVTYSTSSASEPFKTIRQERPDIVKYLNQYNLNTCRCRRVWMKNDDNVDHTYCEVYVGDMLRCRTFNIDGEYLPSGRYTEVDNTDWWTFVCGTGTGSFVDDYDNEYEGYYIDLAFALTGTNPDYKYVPLHTLFSDEDGVVIPENYLMPDIYNELKEITFQCLCGSTQIVEEYIEDKYTVDRITDYDFRIRGMAYITANILGVEYSDESLASLYSMLKGSGLSDNVLYGDEDTAVYNLINAITGESSYKQIGIYNNPYANDIAESIVNGGDVEVSETGDEAPQWSQEYLELANRCEWQFGYGYFNVKTGQQLGCLGHMWDIDRQNAILISATQPIDGELVAPAIAQYNGINVFGASISRFRLSVIAKNGNVFNGQFMVRNKGNYISVDDMINLYVEDIETGLEAVGIHLDGANSTITMKGSVELHQHNDGNNDTLSVWGSDNQKKVEIVPDNIPTMNNLDMTNNTKYVSPTYNFGYKATSVITENEKWVQDFWIFAGHREYQYRLSNYVLNLTNSISLGRYKAGDVVDINNVQINVGFGYTAFRYGTQQALKTKDTSCTGVFKLKRGSTTVYQISKTDINIPADVETFTYGLGQFIDDYQPTNTSEMEYSLEYTLSFNVCTDYTSWSTTRYSSSNWFYNLKGWTWGQCNVSATSTGTSFMQIGTNGMVYSVGNGDYFYSGNDGFAFNYKNNGIKMANNQMKLLRKPQIISGSTPVNDRRIKSEIVICQPSGSKYGIWTPTDGFETGQLVTVVGFKGLEIYTWSDRRFKVFRYDIGEFGTYNYIIFGTSVTEHNYSTESSDPWLEIYTTKLQFVVADDGLYIISGLTA